MSDESKKYVVVQDNVRLTPALTEAEAKAKAAEINQRIQESVQSGQANGGASAEVKEILFG